MEIRVLRYFLETARQGSITRAAQQLHISQPTLSKQIKELERELGKKLFFRRSSSVALTEEGLLLKKRAEDILDMVDKTEDEFRSLGKQIRGDIRIGAAESDNIKYLAHWIQSLQQKYPEIRIHLYSGDTEDLAQKLDQGLLDFAVIAQGADLSRYNCLELPERDVWGVAMRKDAPLAQKDSVSIEDLEDVPLMVSRQGMREDIPRLFGDKAERLNVVITLNLTFNGLIMAREGLGYVLTFDKLMDISESSELCFRPLTPKLETSLFVIWKKHQVFTPAAQALLDEMNQI